MKSVFTSLAAVALFVSGALAQFTINTPTNVVVCQPILLTWSGGTPPYFLSVLPGSQPNAAALVDLGQQSGTSFTWTVNIAAGTSIGLNLRDSSGLVAQSAPFTINSGTDSSCVGKTPSTSAGSATTAAGASSGAPASASAPATGTTPATIATPPIATTPLATTKAAATTTAPPAGSSTAHATTSTSSSNTAPTHAAQMGVAGFVGAAVMALLA